MTELQERVAAGLAERYSIKRELGRGGMASVFLAQDRKHGRPVAVKVLRPEIAGALGTDRFLLEIQIAAHLNHPHVLPLLDSGEADDLLYYVMPYVEGETLRERLTRVGQLSVEDALQITREVANGLAYAHSRGLVHRDIKPENIMLSSGHAVITDFGIARAMDQAGDERLTRMGIAGGTPAYMSPEQWSGAERLDGRSDLYSLACVLYEMLVGEPPFTGPNPQVLMARHLQATIPPARLVRPAVPEHVEEAINRALAKVPEERFESVHDFAEALAASAAPVTETPRRSTVARSSLPPSTAAARTRGAPLPRPLTYAAIALFLLIGAFMAFQRFGVRSLEAAPMRIAVLPFENLGPPEDEYFADGITEEISGRLASIGSLGVIARTSTMQYRGTTQPVDEIGEELGVAYLVTGSVGWERTGANGSGENVRVRVRLVNVTDGTQAWGDNYQVALAGVFEVQSSIAERVAQALNLVLLEPERRRLTAQPTANMEAYDLYLQGNSYYNRSWAREDLEKALEMYERAAQLDPEFALAFAQIARTQAWMYRLRHGQSEDRLVASHRAAERALALDPDLPEAHLSLGLYHYWGRNNYERAVDEFMKARSLQPGNAEVHRQIGNVRRRQGMFDATIESYQRAAELDPRSHINWFNLGETYLFIHQYAAAEPHLDRVLLLAPGFFEGYLQKARLYLMWKGDVAAAREMLRLGEERVPPERWRPWVGFWLTGFTRIVYDDLEGLLDRMAPGTLALDSAVYHAAKGEIYGRLNRRDLMLASYDSARVLLERKREDDPGQAWVHGVLGFVYAGLDRPPEAVRSARRAVELLPVSKDALDGPEWVINLAQVYLLVGDYDAAFNQLSLALSIPAWLSPEWVRRDPLWEPVHHHARFLALLAAHGPPVAAR